MMSSRLAPKMGNAAAAGATQRLRCRAGRDGRGQADDGRRRDHDLRDAGAGQFHGTLKQPPGGLGNLGLDILGVFSLLGADLDLDACRPGPFRGLPANRSVRYSRAFAPRERGHAAPRMMKAAGQRE